jgi:hypothetical protein
LNSTVAIGMLQENGMDRLKLPGLPFSTDSVRPPPRDLVPQLGADNNTESRTSESNP